MRVDNIFFEKKGGFLQCPSCDSKKIWYTGELEFFICDSFLDGTEDRKYNCLDCGTFSEHDGLLFVMVDSIYSTAEKILGFFYKREKKDEEI